MPCYRSHCPATAKSRCCYSSTCLHKLNNRLWRRNETLDRLETQLLTAESGIAALTRRLERDCHHRDCRLDCSTMRAARESYDDTMQYECSRHSSKNASSSPHCCCRECAIGSKDLEMGLLLKMIDVAEAFEDHSISRLRTFEEASDVERRVGGEQGAHAGAGAPSASRAGRRPRLLVFTKSSGFVHSVVKPAADGGPSLVDRTLTGVVERVDTITLAELAARMEAAFDRVHDLLVEADDRHGRFLAAIGPVAERLRAARRLAAEPADRGLEAGDELVVDRLLDEDSVRRDAGLAGIAELAENRTFDRRVEVGDRFSLNSQLHRFAPRDPSNHLDGLWQYLYPSRPTT